MATALLVIDLQVGMFSGERVSPIHDGDGLLDRVGQVIAAARAAGVRVVHVQHASAAGRPLEPGTPGFAIHPRVAPRADEPVIGKATPDAFHDTALAAALAGCTRLVVAGAQTELCVDTTCRRAKSLGYDVTLVADGHSTWDHPPLSAAQIIAHHNRSLDGWFVRLAAADTVSFTPPA